MTPGRTPGGMRNAAGGKGVSSAHANMNDAAESRQDMERIAKRLARAGLCSRREAERWIEAGRVAVDGTVIRTPAVNVTPESHITVDGKPIPEPEPPRLWRYHKPRGLLTASHDPKGRPTIFQHLPGGLPRVISIGRLDLNSEGLLLLTNDGDLARRLELPAHAWVRRYRVRVHGRIEKAQLAALARGSAVEGVRYGPIRATLDRQQGDNAWLTMSLTEGKNREIRRVCQQLGWPVSRLIRVAFGPFQLGHLPPGAVEEVPGKVLREQLGRAVSGARKRRSSHRPDDPGAHADRRRSA
jgi:23S rRNA pseudouridine2605 synthase